MIKAQHQGTTGGGELAPFASSTDRFGLVPGFGFDAMSPFMGFGGLGTPFDVMPSMLFSHANETMRRLAAAAAPMMAIDVHESAKGYAIDADMPGFKRENISVEVSPAPNGGNLLCICAHRATRDVSEDPASRWYRRERTENSVSRTLTMPANLDLSCITSKFENGVLHVELPKLPASQIESSVRKITVS